LHDESAKILFLPFNGLRLPIIAEGKVPNLHLLIVVVSGGVHLTVTLAFAFEIFDGVEFEIESLEVIFPELEEFWEGLLLFPSLSFAIDFDSVLFVVCGALFVVNWVFPFEIGFDSAEFAVEFVFYNLSSLIAIK